MTAEARLTERVLLKRGYPVYILYLNFIPARNVPAYIHITAISNPGGFYADTGTGTFYFNILINLF